MTTGRRGPAGVGYNMQQVSDTCTRIVGRAYVGEITTKGKVVSGTTGNCLGLMFDVNPALLNDRVAVIASTYEKYVYHAMKFTYVPQCATTARGSVGLVFDRDPLQYSANTAGVQFLSEVMSYEHAVLTPGYVEASTAYARDPKELKTWYISSPDSTLSTRDTSQGNLLTYLSNADGNTGYGFIVMDYVLDLVTPNLLPSKQGVTDTKSAPSQWRDFSGRQSAAAGVTTTIFVGSNPLVPIGTGTAQLASYFTNAGLVAQVGPTYARPGVVGEIMLGGLTNALDASVAPAFKTADNADVTIKAGQKLYFTVHVNNDSSTGNDYFAWTLHLTISSARAAASQSITAAASTVNVSFPDQLYVSGATAVEVGGWLRLITDGAGVVNNA